MEDVHPDIEWHEQHGAAKILHMYKIGCDKYPSPHEWHDHANSAKELLGSNDDHRT